MKEHPILFNTEMVKAIRERRKTRSRRLDLSWVKVKAGDHLWVRETWTPFEYCYEDLCPSDLPRGIRIVYLADQVVKSSGDRYRPSIHMPRWASRITLLATADARMEKLCNISEEEAHLEGFPIPCQADNSGGMSAGRHFEYYWKDIYQKSGQRWKDNPEVVVLSFEEIA